MSYLYRRLQSLIVLSTSTFALCFATSVNAVAIPKPLDIRTVAITGDVAPNDSGVFLSQPYAPYINESGQVAFVGLIEGPDIEDDPLLFFSGERGLWSEGSGELQLVAAEQADATGAPAGYTFFSLVFSSGSLRIANDGSTVFNANLATPDRSDWRVGSNWIAGDNGMRLIALEDAPNPAGPPGVTFRFVTHPDTNDLGHTFFLGSVEGLGTSSRTTNYWIDDSAGLRPLFTSGDLLPTELGAIRLTGGSGPPAINNNGTVTFSASGVLTDNTWLNGVWTGVPGDLKSIAYQGQVPPGFPSDVTFHSFAGVQNNDQDHTLFVGVLEGVGIDNSNDQGIWADTGNGLHLVARESQPAAGTTGNSVFLPLQGPVLNVRGQVAFRATLAGPEVTLDNQSGIWLETDGQLGLVARAGESAPGIESGVNFLRFSKPALNDSGIIAFQAVLTGTEDIMQNDQGLWVGRPGNLELVLRSGDLLDVDDSANVDLRAIDTLELQLNGIDQSVLNNRGQLAFVAGFTDGSSGVFVLNTRYVPEPSSVAIAIVLLVCGASLVRRPGGTSAKASSAT